MKILTRFLVRAENSTGGKVNVTRAEAEANFFRSAWALIEDTGWTLEYIRSLDHRDFLFLLSMRTTLANLRNKSKK